MGAWIEILTRYQSNLLRVSRTLYGCVDWNSCRVGESVNLIRSHPLWVRGLKSRKSPCLTNSRLRRTLYGCVDWNVRLAFCRIVDCPSHPLWVRGLKFKNPNKFCDFCESHPLWVRGLKLWSLLMANCHLPVAPFMGAWIEIHCYWTDSTPENKSHPLWVRGLK